MRRAFLLGDGADHAHSGLAGDLECLLHARVFDPLVGPEIQNLVGGAGGVQVRQLTL